MPLVEINFDGIIGPSHNYGGLSHGNLASARNAGAVAFPRAAALQGIEKMRVNLRLGLTQGILLPHARPNRTWLSQFGPNAERDDVVLSNCAMSASAMWAANAATVSPAPDTADGKCHITAANLVTMPHRSHEWPETLRQLKLAFAHPSFCISGPIPPPFGDEGAANHMRLCKNHNAAGIEVFVYGEGNGPFPARQHLSASQAVARKNLVRNPVFVRQSDEAIAAGAFHNDVVAVANERVLFAHQHAFAEPKQFYADLRDAFPDLELIEVPADQISLDEAIGSYLFNGQLVTLPTGAMVLIAPREVQENPQVWAWLKAHCASNGPIRNVIPVDVRQSMANGGGPACLRMRVVCDPSTVDTRFLVTDAQLNKIAQIIEENWPISIDAEQLTTVSLSTQIESARSTLFEALGIGELLSN